MEYVIIGAAAVVIIILLGRFFMSRKGKKDYAPFIKTSGAASPPPVCPVCRSPLPKGVDLFTKVFRPMDVHDQHCVVYGCPQCYASSSPVLPPHSADRLCPVCRRAIPPDGYLVARLFNQTKSGKKHLAVTGCPQCARVTG